MRLLLEVGYQHLLFGPRAKAGPILKALDGALQVESLGYGESRKLVVKGDTRISVEIINDDAVCLPDNKSEQSAQLDKLLAMQEKLSEAQSKIYKLEAQVKAAAEAIAPAKG